MSVLILGVAIWVVRAWTRVYTSGMESAAREPRRAEIESDLWEHQHAGREGARLALEMIGRLLLGAPDDVRWRIEQMSPVSRVTRGIALGAGLLLVIVSLWIGMALAPGTQVELPPGPDLLRTRQSPLPAPPPPPPPPCNPLRDAGRTSCR
ncbi:MAG: hypothetical protein ACRD1U_02320 [Vicinamibacterales bacterium]